MKGREEIRLRPRLRLLLWAPPLIAVVVAAVLSLPFVPVLVERAVGEALLGSLSAWAPLAADRAATSRSQEELQAWTEVRGASDELRLTIVDAAGRVVADSARDLAGVRLMDDHSDRPEVAAALASGRGWSVRRSTTTGDRFVYAARAIATPAGTYVVRAARPIALLETIYLSLAGAFVLALAGGGVAALLVAAWLRRRVERPFGEVVAGARRMAQGPDLPRLRVPRLQELATLARSLNRLADRVEEQVAGKERERHSLEELLEGLPDGVLVVGPAGGPRYANRAFRELLELPLSGSPASFPLERRPEVRQLLEGVGEGGESVEHEIRMGSRLLVARALGLRKTGGAVVVVRDVTQAERLARQRRDFVANVSHELKTPLAVLRAAAETLDEEPGDVELVRRLNGRILDQCRRLEELLADLLVLARLEGTEPEARLASVSVGEVVEQVLAETGEMATGRGVGLAVAVEEGLELPGDAEALTRLLANLVDNASKYNRKGGRVVVRAARHGDEVWLEVEDDGPGIPVGERERVFERFYRVDKGRGRAEGGSGLGLAIVKHAAQRHAGTVEIGDGELGGALVRVRLPAV